MGFSIAVAGKGGTGKTSLCGLTIRYLTEKKRGAVLAVDADANANLNDVLGVKVHATVGKLRETSLEAVKSTAPRPGGMSMEQLFDYQIQQALIEAKGFDLLVMGRPEGAGCYCAANNIIRKYMDKLADTYPYTVMDNEAGLEHLSRRTTQDTDLLLIISDSSVRGDHDRRPDRRTGQRAEPERQALGPDREPGPGRNERRHVASAGDRAAGRRVRGICSRRRSDL